MTVKRVEVLAYAKINLMLDIIRRRTDGYHDLFMIMQSVGVADRVTVEREPGRKLRLTASMEDIPLDDKNIAWKAATLFFKTTGLRRPGLHIHLEKHIPHAAGLAGGSADGAAVLVALNRLMGTGLSTDQLCDMGVQIGADVPFCIVGGTCLAQGIGEVLSPLKPMPSCHIVLAKPDFGVNTGKAYGLFDTNGKTHNADQLGMLTAVQNRDLPAICGKLENVFEQFVEVPGRIEMKEVLRAAGAAGVCMSGSGPTLFGIFTDKAQALAAAQDLAPFAKDIAVTKPVRQGCKIVEVISDCG